MTYYVHNVPGRLRVKIPAIKGAPDRARTIQRVLSEIEGVISIRANMLTGSLVVKYDEAFTSGRKILEELKSNRWFDETQAIGMDRMVFDASSKAGKAISKAFAGWAVGRALEGTSLSFLAVFI